MYVRIQLNKIDRLVALKLFTAVAPLAVKYRNFCVVERDLSKLAVAMSELRYDGRVAVVTGAGGG